jgi:HPt (histidine-containing phosphotransfer) domain-containing protein
MLKAKMGNGGIDPAAIARAEAAVEEISNDFPAWMQADVERLAQRHAEFVATKGAELHTALHRATHDVKGHAATLGYPLAARVAASLCDLLESELRPAALVAAHVDVIQMIVRDSVRDESDPAALALVEALEAQSAELRALRAF